MGAKALRRSSGGLEKRLESEVGDRGSKRHHEEDAGLLTHQVAAEQHREQVDHRVDFDLGLAEAPANKAAETVKPIVAEPHALRELKELLGPARR